MKIERNRYLQKLINSRKNGQVKIITGVRRCGKSYLLSVLYRDYLLREGVLPEQIITVELDNDINVRYRNPLELGAYLREKVANAEMDYYILLDEIQMVESIKNPYMPKESDSKITFVDVLLGLRNLPHVDVYVTGSNSKMLSSDVATAFRDRGEENHIMENIIYNELVARGFNVDVGVVEYNHIDENGKKVRSQLEVDFVVNQTEKRYYIQSALTVADEEKRKQEVNSLNRIDDSYTKIVVVRDNVLPWTDDKGVQYINIEDFLLDKINEL